MFTMRQLGNSQPRLSTALRLSLDLPDELSIGGGTDYPFGLSLAPDGRRLVFPAVSGGTIQLWLKDLTTGDTQPLPGTHDGVLPFWSPDGRNVGFFATGKLRVFAFENGRVIDVAEAPSPRGAAWHPNGDIIFAPNTDGPLFRRTSDGVVQPYSVLDPGETGHRLPAFLDNGRLVMFFVRSSEATRQGVWIAAVAQPTDRKRVVKSDGHGVALDDAAILYSSDGVLVAQPIDLDTRTPRGRSELVGGPVGHSPHNQLFATVGGDVLVFGAPASGLRTLKWMDRAGETIGVVGEPMESWDVRVAPRGASVAVARVDPQLKTLDIWTYEGERPLPRRISTSIDVDDTPVWSSDGMQLAWVSARRTLMVRGALAELPEQSLRQFANVVRATGWSADAKWIVVSEVQPATRADIWVIPASGDGEPIPYAQTPFNETFGAVSPDGQWLVYASDESGRFEIYLDAFPAPGRRVRLSLGGATEPRWSGDGTEIFFRRGNEIHVVRPNFASSAPEAMTTERLFDAGADIRAYDVAVDGKRFLLNLPAAERAVRPMSVVVNIRSLLPSAP